MVSGKLQYISPVGIKVLGDLKNFNNVDVRKSLFSTIAGYSGNQGFLDERAQHGSPCVSTCVVSDFLCLFFGHFAP